MAEWQDTGAASLASITRDTSTLVDAQQEMQALVETIWRLRQPDGCPWDRKQTHESIAKNMIEEAYEAVDCIEAGDAQHLREELGDVLMQVVVHAGRRGARHQREAHPPPSPRVRRGAGPNGR